jgi:hypothetical protein
MSEGREPISPEESEGEGWQIREGQAQPGSGGQPWRGDVENLTYNNPFGLELERVWFDGKIVFAADAGEVDIDPERVQVAQEYQVVYSVELDGEGNLGGKPERVEGQYNIYDSVPGMEKYSPIWQFNYVIVPQDYQPNTLRSERDCRESGYEILRSNVFEN